MARLTITLPDAVHQALKEAAARRKKTIGELISEAVEFYGIKTELTALELIAQAQAAAGMTEEEAMELAVRETRAARAERVERAR